MQLIEFKKGLLRSFESNALYIVLQKLFYGIKIIFRLYCFSCLCITLTLCTPSQEACHAPEVIYYLTVESQDHSQSAQRIKTYLQTEIPQKKYAITNQSGISWPYFQSFDLKEPVCPDSLMPPHTFVHRVKPIITQNQEEIKAGDYRVLITLMPTPDTLLNYNVTIHLKQPEGIEKSGESGIHFLDTINTLQPWLPYLKESIIRYSFK